MRPHPRGATWHGMQIVLKHDDGSVINLTGASEVAMHVREKKDDTKPPAMVFTTADNTITILNPEQGKIVILGRVINVRPFNYITDIRVIMPDGAVVYLPERSWEIYQTVTR